ncbi:MAG: flagellar assembly protein FliW [Proteobacteria bacterium]|nr:flagellar assembly protein FliW [Pseudomonadota bacterium]MBU4297948.1 flagellar assembly protein FliW [Pseudomonadota bacterium]MCG2746055.1 flagellar assembly protein FliW [Desulfobulbaceae bacterium]
MNVLKQDIYQSEAEKNITVQTSRFGEIIVDKERIISLLSPFLGFPESTRFILKSHSPKSPFMWLQSLDNPQLAFVVLPAALAGLDYQPEIPRQILKELLITADSDKDILLILTIPKNNPQEMTANLLGPIVLNSSKRLAVQAVLDPQKYDPCWRLFPAK